MEKSYDLLKMKTVLIRLKTSLLLKKGIVCFLFIAILISYGYCASELRNNPSDFPNLDVSIFVTIQGTITDSDGNPLPGVNILKKGTSIGTQTNIDGKYSIEAELGTELEFTFLGMKPVTVTVQEETTINIQMVEDARSLEEVIIVGYGSSSKAKLTGAVTNIKTEEISDIAASNMTSLLAGRLTGVFIQNRTGTPGVSSELTVRTRGTWNDASTIYVIDGIVRDKSDFDALDVNEVEEVSILKDAASAAVYGSRASNGVVVVSTKKGKLGKPVINYTFNYNLEKPTVLPEMMSALDITTLANKTYNQYYPEDGDAFWRSFTHWEDEDIAFIKTINDGYGYDYLGTIYQDPSSMRNALSVSGGTENIKYYVGGSIFGQDGFLEPLKYDKSNLRANVDVKLNKNLTANLNIATVNSKREKFYWPFDGGNDELTDLWKKLQTWQYYEPALIDGKAPNLGWLGNVPSLLTESGYWEQRNQSQNAIMSLNYEVPFIEGLSVKTTYALDNTVSNLKNFQKKHTLYDIQGHSLHNYADVEFTGTTTQSSAPSRESIQQSINTDRAYQFNTQLNYRRAFGNHNLNALFVYEQSEQNFTNVNATRYDFPILVRDQWDFTSGAPEDSRAGGSESETGRLSYVGRLLYDYNDKYLFNASFRYDGSIIFAPSERWGFFPSVSAGWVISEEDFFNIGWINRAKLRASYGTLGNDRVSPWRWQEQYVAANGFYFGSNPREVKGITYGGITNKLATWEKTKNIDLGFDLDLTNGFGLVFNYFTKHTEDILGSQVNEVPSTFGGVFPAVNYGEMSAKGYEVELDYTNHIGKFNYYIGGNFGMATNEVINISQAENIRDYQNRIGRSWNYIVGYEYDDILRTQADIDALPDGWTIGNQIPQLGQINYKDLSGPDGTPDGKIDSWDQTVIADNAAPVSTYGIKLGGEYSGFTLDVLFQGAGGYKKILDVQDPFPWTRIYAVWEDYWSEDNPNASMPSPNFNYGSNQWTSTFWLKDASYLRLKFVNLGYNLPKNIIGRIGVENFKIFMSGTNLLTFSKFKTYDVELAQAGSYPNMQNYSFGVNVTF